MARRFEKYQVEILNFAFDESQHLKKSKKMELAEITGLDMEQIASWFNRKRVRKRNKESFGQLERINDELRKSLQKCRDREANLLKRLREGQDREADLRDENLRLKRRLAIAECDLQFDYTSQNWYP